MVIYSLDLIIITCYYYFINSRFESPSYISGLEKIGLLIFL